MLLQVALPLVEALNEWSLPILLLIIAVGIGLAVYILLAGASTVELQSPERSDS